VKYDVIVKNDPSLKGLNHKLGLYFNPTGKMCRHYVEFQIGSRPLAEYIMGKTHKEPEVAPPIRRAVVPEAPTSDQ
jgi:hypothetical protein